MKKTKTNWAHIRSLAEDEIEQRAQSDPDTIVLDDAELWKNARVVYPSSETKLHISIRLDKDIIDFFRSEDEKGYQKRINAVLRSYVETKKGMV